jgi:hypothetical protein
LPSRAAIELGNKPCWRGGKQSIHNHAQQASPSAEQGARDAEAGAPPAEARQRAVAEVDADALDAWSWDVFRYTHDQLVPHVLVMFMRLGLTQHEARGPARARIDARGHTVRTLLRVIVALSGETGCM